MCFYSETNAQHILGFQAIQYKQICGDCMTIETSRTTEAQNKNFNALFTLDYKNTYLYVQ